MPPVLQRSLRGAVAGAAAAAAWAATQPLDKKVFGVDYDDAAFLGLAVTRGPAHYPVGVAMHLLNGALFGAVYANVAPSLPLPRWATGVAAGMAEHAATWPLTRFADVHPAADRFPVLWGSNAALAQATWRHLLFGAVLGEVERRLNPPGAEEPDVPSADDVEVAASTNGHGPAERLAAAPADA